MTKAKVKQERSYDKPDLSWKCDPTTYSIYLLEKDEFFDPRTSSKGRHHVYGPAMVVVEAGLSHKVSEHYLNDPKIWQWVRRLIRDGHLNQQNIAGPFEETEVEESKPRFSDHA